MFQRLAITSADRLFDTFYTTFDRSRIFEQVEASVARPSLALFEVAQFRLERLTRSASEGRGPINPKCKRGTGNGGLDLLEDPGTIKSGVKRLKYAISRRGPEPLQPPSHSG